MKKQDYSNHVRYWAPHHFVFYPVVLFMIVFTIFEARNNPGQSLIWIAISIVFGMICWLSFMMRQHYALGNQNRIVRLELRLRYFQLTNQKLESIEEKLSFAQLSALRFASDIELPALVERALKEGLSATDIKKSITNWLPDYMRV